MELPVQFDYSSCRRSSKVGPALDFVHPGPPLPIMGGSREGRSITSPFCWNTESGGRVSGPVLGWRNLSAPVRGLSFWACSNKVGWDLRVRAPASLANTVILAENPPNRWTEPDWGYSPVRWGLESDRTLGRTPEGPLENLPIRFPLPTKLPAWCAVLRPFLPQLEISA